MLEKDNTRDDVYRINVGNLPPGKEATLRIYYLTELDTEGMFISDNSIRQEVVQIITDLHEFFIFFVDRAQIIRSSLFLISKILNIYSSI